MKASNSSLRQLIEGTKVFSVPLYQRRYSWERKNWLALWQSVLEQYDFSLAEPDGAPPVTHFIGSFVLAPAPGAASAPTKYVLVDGQQRLTTTMLALTALRDLLADGLDDHEQKTALVNKYNTLYLHNSFETDPGKKLRLLPTQQDRADYVACVGRTPADPQGRMGEAYNFFRSNKAMRGVDLKGEPLDLERVSEVLLSRLALVEITTESGDNVHQIFSTLNSAGVKLKQVDLLRNHFFMLLPTRGEQIYTEVWRDMELRLGEAQMDRFFWAQLVRTDARVSRTDVYAAMQRVLDPIAHDEAAVETELRRMNADSADYLAIVARQDSTPKAIEDRLDFLRTWGSETARPLILELLTRLRTRRLNESDVVDSLQLIESFLVRRMVVGIPTNNLNRIFSSITPVLARSEFGARELAASLAGGQKYWPSDDQVANAMASRPFYFSGQPHQRRQILLAIANLLAGKEPMPADESVTIEHVLPQTPTQDWLRTLSSDREIARQIHDQYVHTIGNLTLTGYNSELSNAPYAEKRRIYSTSSFAITRAIANDYEVWNEQSIKARSVAMARSLVAIWPGPVNSQIDIQRLGHASVEDALLLLPSGAWTTLEELCELSGLGEQELSHFLQALPDSITSRVRSDGEPEGLKKGMHNSQMLAGLIADNEDSSST